MPRSVFRSVFRSVSGFCSVFNQKENLKTFTFSGFSELELNLILHLTHLKL